MKVPLTISRPVWIGVSAVTWEWGRHHSRPKTSGTLDLTNRTRPDGTVRSAPQSASSW